MNLLHKKVKNLIDGACRILLLSDERIDGDTIGSTLGMYHVLKAEGKDVRVFSPGNLVDTLEFLPGVDVIERNADVFEDGDYDLVMVFDCADGLHFKENLPKMSVEVPLVVFDHHETNPEYGDVNVIEPHAASTADVVWRFVKAAKFKMNKEAAQCFLTGVITDTKAFSTANTTEECLQAAKDLVGHGAKFKQVIHHTFFNRPLPTLRLWGLALERLHYSEEYGALVTMITRKDMKKCGVSDEESDTKAFSEMLNLMSEGQDAIMVFRETKDGGVKAGMRSQKKNVAAFAEARGGGGHRLAAGFKIENARLVKRGGKWEVRKVDA